MQEELEERKQLGRYRQLIDYSSWIDFCSNDYLCIGRDRVLEAPIAQYLDAWQLPSYSSGGSRLISGHAPYHDIVEQKIAAHHGAESALLFDNGYLANHGLVTAIGQRGTTLLLDAHCHASIIRSAHQSQADHVYKFAHQNLEALEHKLRRSQGRVVVIAESVYSMDGDCTDVHALLDVSARYGAQVIVDEAHAFGWQGPQRIGTALPAHEALLARVFTYGKGAGCHGAALVGSRLLRDFLINTCAPFIYSTATTAHTAAAICSAYDYVLAHPERTTALLERIAFWRERMGPTRSTPSPIQIIRHPNAQALAARAQHEGFAVKAILPPTVQPEHTCVRVCLHSDQRWEDMERLIQLIEQPL